MVLFSGILPLAVEEKAPSIFYQDIPHYPFHHTAGPGDEGKLYFGRQGNRDVIVFSGRAHCYQGYSLAQVCIQTPAAADIIVKSTFSINDKDCFPCAADEASRSKANNHHERSGGYKLTIRGRVLLL